MSKHHDVELPSFLYPFIQSSFVMETNIVTSHSGKDFVKNSHDFPVHQYKISGAKINAAQYEEFYGFYNARKGPLFSFKLKDIGDNKVDQQPLIACSSNPLKFYLLKQYNSGTSCYFRRLSLIKQESIKIIRSNEEIAFRYLPEEKAILIDSPLGMNENLITSFEFDIKVRFITCNISYCYCLDGSILLNDIILKEVLDV